MRPSDQSEFVKLLNLCYSTLLRPLPTFEAIDLWQTILEDRKSTRLNSSH